jgi:hypothetical protein
VAIVADLRPGVDLLAGSPSLAPKLRLS